ncbi:DUF721 domain-containing protein [Dokdonia sinensis]|uniref:DUF721 domain-containing protein n=1 Tax=Dokdonia sinensis TaxID=2479847 RepID=A0A3M0H2W4_9FLAO|nr:DUF721 domain-containing protein [Dokdonia sinensis]RMB63996.1 DUF721 domain-containing protein [Dokdonia sinensis]
MTKRNTDPISISAALGEFVEKNKLQKGIDKVNVADAWYALNPVFKKYTTSIRFERETLFINLSSSVFREELSYGKEKIVQRLNEAIGKDVIKKLVLR